MTISCDPGSTCTGFLALPFRGTKSLVYRELVIDVRAHLTRPGGLVSGTLAVDAGDVRKRLTAAVTSLTDIVAGTLLVFAGSQAVDAKFHNISPMIVILVPYHTGRVLSRNFRGFIHQESYVPKGIDYAHKHHHGGIESYLAFITCGNGEYAHPSTYAHSGEEKESCCIRHQSFPDR